MILSHILVEYFEKGGPIMWPMALLFFLAICVILDRVIWWLRLRARINAEQQEAAREALGLGQFDQAWQTTNKHPDPFLENLRDGLSHAATSPTSTPAASSAARSCAAVCSPLQRMYATRTNEVQCISVCICSSGTCKSPHVVE